MRTLYARAVLWLIRPALEARARAQKHCRRFFASAVIWSKVSCMTSSRFGTTFTHRSCVTSPSSNAAHSLTCNSPPSPSAIRLPLPDEAIESLRTFKEVSHA